MSIKDLFKKGSNKVLSATSIDVVGSEVESELYVDSEIREQEYYVPPIDFSNPKNFVKFGSAEKYYIDSIQRVYNTYPFDGSLYEKQEYFNSSSFLDNYIFEKEYPRVNGYAKLCADGWGAGAGGSSGHSLSEPVTKEYIKIYGTMNETNVYHTASNRAANFYMNGNVGNTVEFWLKKGGLDVSLREMIFDLWNGQPVSAVVGNPYARLSLIIGHTGVGLPSSLFVTYISGADGMGKCSFDNPLNPIGEILCDETWNHYAISFKNASNGTSLDVLYYVNGALSSSHTFTNSSIGEVTGSFIAYIGGAQTQIDTSVAEVANPAGDGWGKLSGSIDEFRFWKAKRSHKDIGRHWFTQLGVFGAGGTNTDDSNTTLGAYYKFNEGITGVTATDSVVLDYSGRISHGTWTGYESSHRSTNSAMVEASVTLSEFKDPIMYSFHPEVSTLLFQKQLSGSAYDYLNNTSLVNSIPAEIMEEDTKDENFGNLYNLTQIMASYLDTLQHQIKYLPNLREARYVTGSLMKPSTLASRLLESVGFVTPEIFADSEIISQFLSRDEDKVFQEKLYDVKNLIYQNIYNNLAYIYKSKGTEKSFRNLIRCFGIDDELIKINLYGNNATYDFRDNVKYTSVKKRYVDFNNVDRFDATVYQYTASSNANSVSYISASGPTQGYEGTGSAITIEAEVMFPKKYDVESATYFETPFLSSSLFGIHTAKTGNVADTSWDSPDSTNFQVYAVRDKIESKNAYFKLTSSVGGYFPLLTSSTYYNVYDNQKWNFAVRVKPAKYPLVNLVTGTMWSNYDVEFYGVKAISGYISEEFLVTASISSSYGSAILANPKRIYIGAQRNNFTSSLIDRSDVQISSVRYWLDYLNDDIIKAHAKDATNNGVMYPYENAYLLQTSLNNVFIPKIETLALNWDFATVTSSNTSGQFMVEDVSSGSLELKNRYNWIGNIVKSQHTGRGDFFLADDDRSIDVEYVYSAKQKLPESLDSSDMIEILERDDEIFTKDTRPITYFVSLEKSMYQTISEEMINIFATIKDFNNLIGEPVNRYRQEYKSLSKLRSLFFERVQNTPSLETYIEFYKWIDSALSNMLMQLVPASAEISDGIENVIESHILERSKYWTKFPTLEMKLDDPEGGTYGINSLTYNWKYGHAPIGNSQQDNRIYWKEKALRSDLPLSSSTLIDDNKSKILSASLQVLNRSFTTPYKFSVEEPKTIYNGVNFNRNKTFSYVKSSTTYGNITKDYMFAKSSSMIGVEDTKDYNDLNLKKRRNFQVINVALNSSSYSTLESDIALPFEIYSSSVTIDSGYTKFTNGVFVSGTILTNLHSDTYGNDKETPVQGPFTEKYVGGLQYRHIQDFTVGNETTRPEGWRILFNNKTMFMHGPEVTSSIYGSSIVPRANCYRNVTAKRPINIENILSGNYSKDYEVVQTSGRYINNKAFVMSGGFAIMETLSPYIYGISDYAKPRRGSDKNIFVERFSAPGGPETSGDCDGGIGLDLYSAEFSVYNSLNYRNSLVRGPLQTLLTRRMGQFGTDSIYGVVHSSDYQSSASYHKVHYNTLERMELSGSGTGSYLTGTLYDNWYVQHPIPQDDAAYAWIQACSYMSGTNGD